MKVSSCGWPPKKKKMKFWLGKGAGCWFGLLALWSKFDEGLALACQMPLYEELVFLSQDPAELLWLAQECPGPVGCMEEIENQRKLQRLGSTCNGCMLAHLAGKKRLILP